MPHILCHFTRFDTDERRCTRKNCSFVHPGQPHYERLRAAKLGPRTPTAEQSMNTLPRRNIGDRDRERDRERERQRELDRDHGREPRRESEREQDYRSRGRDESRDDGRKEHSSHRPGSRTFASNISSPRDGPSGDSYNTPGLQHSDAARPRTQSNSSTSTFSNSGGTHNLTASSSSTTIKPQAQRVTTAGGSSLPSKHPVSSVVAGSLKSPAIPPTASSSSFIAPTNTTSVEAGRHVLGQNPNVPAITPTGPRNQRNPVKVTTDVAKAQATSATSAVPNVVNPSTVAKPSSSSSSTLDPRKRPSLAVDTTAANYASGQDRAYGGPASPGSSSTALPSGILLSSTSGIIRRHTLDTQQAASGSSAKIQDRPQKSPLLKPLLPAPSIQGDPTQAPNIPPPSKVHATAEDLTPFATAMDKGKGRAMEMDWLPMSANPVDRPAGRPRTAEEVKLWTSRLTMFLDMIVDRLTWTEHYQDILELQSARERYKADSRDPLTRDFMRGTFEEKRVATTKIIEKMKEDIVRFISRDDEPEKMGDLVETLKDKVSGDKKTQLSGEEQLQAALKVLQEEFTELRLQLESSLTDLEHLRSNAAITTPPAPSINQELGTNPIPAAEERSRKRRRIDDEDQQSPLKSESSQILDLLALQESIENVQAEITTLAEQIRDTISDTPERKELGVQVNTPAPVAATEEQVDTLVAIINEVSETVVEQIDKVNSLQLFKLQDANRDLNNSVTKLEGEMAMRQTQMDDLQAKLKLLLDGPPVQPDIHLTLRDDLVHSLYSTIEPVLNNLHMSNQVELEKEQRRIMKLAFEKMKGAINLEAEWHKLMTEKVHEPLRISTKQGITPRLSR